MTTQAYENRPLLLEFHDKQAQNLFQSVLSLSLHMSSTYIYEEKENKWLIMTPGLVSWLIIFHRQIQSSTQNELTLQQFHPYECAFPET